MSHSPPPRLKGTLQGLADRRPVPTIRSFRVVVTRGPDAGTSAASVEGRLTVGGSEGVTLQLTDPTVSRFHVELEATAAGIVVRDLKSTNGTFMGETCVREVVVRGPVELALGDSRVRVELGEERPVADSAPLASFGSLIGSSAAMRAVYSVLLQAAPTTAPVLVTGETGTGKELAARAVHLASPRAREPFEVVDCGGVPATLIESELFGHERGAFTSAVSAAEGAFERADGGTLFLDELGDLPLEVQPKLLRALGEREIRRIGGKHTRKVDVRVVAATHRDLRRDVNSGKFRADLFYRIAVIQARMPPLRDRLEDLPELARALLQAIGRDRGIDVPVELDGSLLRTLASHSWPGNVRELRNHLEQLVILRSAPPLGGGAAGPTARGTTGLEGLDKLPLRVAKDQLLERFERDYVACLLEQTGGNVAEAARRAGVDRRTLFRTIRRYGLRGSPE